MQAEFILFQRNQSASEYQQNETSAHFKKECAEVCSLIKLGKSRECSDSAC